MTFDFRLSLATFDIHWRHSTLIYGMQLSTFDVCSQFKLPWQHLPFDFRWHRLKVHIRSWHLLSTCDIWLLLAIFEIPFHICLLHSNATFDLREIKTYAVFFILRLNSWQIKCLNLQECIRWSHFLVVFSCILYFYAVPMHIRQRMYKSRLSLHLQNVLMIIKTKMIVNIEYHVSSANKYSKASHNKYWCKIIRTYVPNESQNIVASNHWPELFWLYWCKMLAEKQSMCDCRMSFRKTVNSLLG